MHQYFKLRQPFPCAAKLTTQRKGKDMLKTVRRLLGNNSGATAIEYGLIAALISIAAIVAMTQVGTDLSLKFGEVSTALTDAGAAGGDGAAGDGAAGDGAAGDGAAAE